MRLKILLITVALFVGCGASYGQIAIPSATAVTENFTIGTSAAASLPANWKMSVEGATSPTWAAAGNFTTTTQQASSGTPNAGGRYNWGNGTTTTDRSLGFMGSGGYNAPNSIMAYYQNTSGVQINDLVITFDYERYRINTAACAITFFTSTDGSTWTARTAGDSGAFATGANAYNFTSGTVVSRSVTLSGINIANNGNFYLRWNFNTTASNSQGVGLDNVSLTATLAASSGYYWNGGTIATSPAAGGTGAWTTANSWRQPSASGAQATWANANPAIIAGTAGTITLASNVTPTSTTFNTTGYTLATSGASALSLGGTVALSTNALTIAPISGANLTIAGVISGSGAAASTIFTKSGTGNLILSENNTFTGKILINGGFIQATGESAFGASPGGFTADQITLNGGGVLAATGNINFSSDRGITLGASGGTFDASASRTITLTNVVTGAGGLTKIGVGLLSLPSAHTYTGNTTISAGALALSGSGSIANSPAITVGSGGTFDVTALTTALALGASQKLVGSATGANTTGTITVASGKGITLSAGGLQFSAYGGGSTAPITVTGASAGAMALNSAPVTINTSTALTAGTYTIIAKGGSATGVTGTPGTLTVTGSGLAVGTTGALSVVSGQLILTVTSGFTVTFKANGGTGADTTQTASTATTLTNNTFTRTGYTFAGWNTISIGGGTAYANGASYPFTADNTLYAQWIATYTFTYNGNSNTSGTVPTDLTSPYTAGATVTVKANTGTLVRTGYTFAGWNTASNGGGTDYAATGSATLTMPSANTILYAKWTPNNNIITFDGNVFTSGSMSNQTLATAATANLTANGYLRTGYTFNGWNTLANGTGTNYADGASYTMGTASVTLYAKWTANDYTITFNGNGSTGGSTATQTIASGATAALTTNGFTRTGYAFDGWATTAGGPVAYSNGANYTMGTANVTLFAQWIVYTGPCQSDNFDSGYGNWTGGTGTYQNTTAAYSGNGTGFNDANDAIITSFAIIDASSINFYGRASGATSNFTIKLQSSSSASGPWTDEQTLSANGSNTGTITDTFNFYSINFVSTGNYFLRIILSARSNGSFYLDDVDVFCGSSCIPTVSTPTSISITTTTATLGGNIDNEGCSDVTTRGVEWSTISGFANGAGTIVSASGSFTTGVFTQQVTGLPSGAVIYYKAFATNTEGTAYSGQASFTTLGPEINLKGVTGSNPSIADGDTVPQGTDNTLFGTTDVGLVIEKIFRIENEGTEVLNITSISMVGGTAPSDFVISGITLPTTIAVGASLDLLVTFSPSAGGTRNTTLTIANDDYDENPYNFVIQGTGNVVASVDINVKGNSQSIPDNSIYPFPLDHTAFGSATVGVTTVTRTFTIENLGSSSLTLTGTPLVSVTGPHATLFTVTVQPSATIAGGSSSTFQVTFNPTSLGTKNATIVIANNDSDENPYNFNISGIAKGNKNIYVYGNGNDVNSGATTTSLTNLTNFGPIAVTTGVKQNTFVISNLSSAERYFSNVSISGTDAAMFTVVAQPIVNAISSGNSTSFTINFTPTSVGTKNALITFSSYTNNAKTVQDSSDPSTYTFAISGDGIVYTVCNIGPVQTIAQQDFEDTPATPTLGYTYTTEGVVSITGGTFNNGSGSKNAFIGAKSFQFKGIGTSNIKTTVVNLNTVDVSKYVNINLSFKTGAFRTGTTQGLDINEFIQVESSIDGGASWSTEGVLRAYSNSRWDFAATGVFNVYYTGNNNGATIDSRNGGAELANGYATYNVKNLPKSSNLLLRLTLVIDRDDEIWAIDNIKIEGQLPLTTTWNGTWSSSAPTSSTKAIFDANYTTSTTNPSIKACECQINTNKTVIISSGYYLEDQSDLTNNGVLIIENNGSLIQVNDYSVNSGNITYERNYEGIGLYDYTYWSSPVAGQNLLALSPTTKLDKFYYFNASINDWQPVNPATTPMDIGKGYIIRAAPISGPIPPGGLTNRFIGVPNNGVKNVPIYWKTGDLLGTSNLIGNPYPSAIDAVKFLTANVGVIESTIYFWTHATSIQNRNLITGTNPDGTPKAGTGELAYTTDDYASFNLTGGVATGNIIPGTPPTEEVSNRPNGKIAAGQAFFATSLLANGTATFNNSMRLDNSNNVLDNSQFFRTKNPKTKIAAIEKHRIWLNLRNKQGVFKQTLIGYLTEATNQYDSRFDGETFDGNEFADFYSVNQDKNLVIQGRALPFDENDEVPLGFRTTIDGAFTINIDQTDGVLTNQAVFIEDKLTNTIFDLRTGPFTFNTAAGTFNDRFVLRYTNKTLGTGDVETLENQVLVSNKNKQIKVNSAIEIIDKVTVYDLLGRQLFKKDKVNNTEFSILNLISNSETLLVKVTLQNGETVTRKIIF